MVKNFLSGMMVPAGIVYRSEQFVLKSRPAEHQGSSESSYKYRMKRMWHWSSFLLEMARTSSHSPETHAPSLSRSETNANPHVLNEARRNSKSPCGRYIQRKTPSTGLQDYLTHHVSRWNASTCIFTFSWRGENVTTHYNIFARAFSALMLSGLRCGFRSRRG